MRDLLKRATHRDIGVRFVAANVPDHDTIATFRRLNLAAFGESFLQVLLLAKSELKLVKVGLVSVIAASASASAGMIQAGHRGMEREGAGAAQGDRGLDAAVGASRLEARAEAGVRAPAGPRGTPPRALSDPGPAAGVPRL